MKPRHPLLLSAAGVIDQGLYGASNLAMTLLIAHGASARTFGTFSAIYAFYVVAFGLFDGLTGEALSVRSGGDHVTMLASVRAAAGASALAGTGVAALGLVAGLALPNERGMALALSLSVPALFLQGLWRFAFFVLGRPLAALGNELVWITVQAALTTVVLVSGHDTAGWLVATWGAGAGVAAIVGAVQLRLRPDWRNALPWLRSTKDLGPRYMAEFGALYGSSQAVLVALGWISGLTSVARLRATQVLFGPLHMLLNAMRVAVVPMASRRRGRQLDGIVASVSAVLVAATAVWTAAAFALPDRLGETLLGDSWTGTGRVLPAVAANVLVVGLGYGPLVGLRALAAARDTLRVRLLMAIGGIVLGVAGAFIDGGAGAAWGITAANGVGSAMLIVLYIRRSGAHRPIDVAA